MKLVRIRKNDSVKHRRGDADFDRAFFDAYDAWYWKKEKEARSVSPSISMSRPSFNDDDLQLRVQVGGARFDKQEIKAKKIPEAIEFCDKTAAECKQKFPGVKVDW